MLLENVRSLLKPGDTVAVLGLSYKPDTYIVEESVGLFLAQRLKRQGYRVWVHDYAATPSNSPSLHEFEVLTDPFVLRNDAEVKVAVLCSPWPQYKTVRLHPNTRMVSHWKI